MHSTSITGTWLTPVTSETKNFSCTIPQQEPNETSRTASNNQPDTGTGSQIDTETLADEEASDGCQKSQKWCTESDAHIDKAQSEAEPVCSEEKTSLQDHPATGSRRNVLPMTPSNPALPHAKDRTTQTGPIQAQSKTTQTQVPERTLNLEPAMKHGPWVRTFPMTTSPLGSLSSSRPFLASMALRSPHRTLDEGRPEWTGDRGKARASMNKSPTREVPKAHARPKPRPKQAPVSY